MTPRYYHVIPTADGQFAVVNAAARIVSGPFAAASTAEAAATHLRREAHRAAA